MATGPVVILPASVRAGRRALRSRGSGRLTTAQAWRIRHGLISAPLDLCQGSSLAGGCAYAAVLLRAPPAPSGVACAKQQCHPYWSELCLPPWGWQLAIDTGKQIHWGTPARRTSLGACID